MHLQPSEVFVVGTRPFPVNDGSAGGVGSETPRRELALSPHMILWRVAGDPMKFLRPIIISHIEQVATEQEKRLAPLVDDLVLADSGLDSLSFAILVARLEDELGLDPFTASTDTHYPITLGDFVKFYEDASQKH
jgi:acyl carrier protein